MSICLMAQVCKKGHLINEDANTHPEYNKKFCTYCGAETITNCVNCGAEIHACEWKGIIHIDSFCYNCGEPHPWTKDALLAAAALIYETEEIPDDLKDRTVETLRDVITETPSTTLAVTRLKKCMTSAGKFASDSLRQFVIEFGCELAVRILGS